MAKREKSGFGAAAGFIIASLLSVLAGIASVVLCFFDWFTIKTPILTETFSLLKFHKGIVTIKGNIQDIFATFASLLGEDSAAALQLPKLDQLELISLIVIALVFVLAAIQLIYIFFVVSGKRGTRVVGILAGLLTIAFAVGLVVMVLMSNAEFNSSVKSLLDLTDGLVTMETLGFNANKIFTFTPFPFLTATCGLAEMIFAR